MTSFVIRRFAYSLLLLFFASVLVFYGLRLAPGDIVSAIASPTTTRVVRISLTRELGLNKPLLTQYFIFVGNLLGGHPGLSVVNGATITSILGSAGPKRSGSGSRRRSSPTRSRSRSASSRAGGTTAQWTRACGSCP